MEPHGAAPAVSDSESSVTGGEVTIPENLRSIQSIRDSFLAGLGSQASGIHVHSIASYAAGTPFSRARIASFKIFARATAQMRGGDSNVKTAWYGASGGIEEVREIFQNGFGHAHIRGLRLSPEECPALSMRRSVPDENGFRHMLLCRVILGRMEVVPPGSDQHHSISNEYDSGVDNVSFPKEYIIRSSRMNTHVLPEHVLCFRAPPGHLTVLAQGPETPMVFSIPFPTLFKALSKILPSPDMAFIERTYHDYTERKIARQLLVSRLRVIAGEKLVVDLIKSYEAHQQNRSANHGNQSNVN